MNLNIKNGLQKTKIKLSSLSLKNKIVFAVSVILLVAGVTYLLISDRNKTDKEKEEVIVNPYKEDRKVTGGDPNLFIKYHKEALAAWKSGDKSKAKELAQKGLDVNNQLTPEQQEKIPKQSDKSYDLYDITRDLYEAN